MARSAKVNVGGSASTSKPRRKRRSRLGRFLLVSFMLILVLLIGLVALAPTIASSMAPGIIENALNPKLKGSIDVTDVHVRWTQAGSPVQTATAAVYDDRQNKIAQVTLESQFGIFSVLGGIGNLGEFVVTGEADIVRHADGTTNIERVFAPMMQPAPSTPPSQPSSQPAKLPPNLRAVLRIASLTGTYTDESLPVPLQVELEKMTARIVFATGQPLEVTLDAEVLTDAPGAAGAIPGAPTPAAARQRGTLSIAGNVDHVSSTDGSLTIDQADADITITARDLPLAVADSVAGLNGTLTRAIGDRLGFDITVAGTMKQGNANLSVATNGGTSLTGRLGFADNVLTTTQPIVFTLDTARAAAADPAIQAALSSSEAARITTLPTLSVTLADLSVRVPAGGAPLDLRGTRATVTAALGEMAGSVMVPGQSTARTFRLTPMNVVVSVPDLAQGVTIATSGQASIDNQPAGNLRLDARATNLLDASGKPSTGLPTIAGQAVVEDFALPIFQPILDALAPTSGITLASAIGPTLNFSLGAESETSGGAPLAPGQIPPTTVTLAMDSANITAGGNVRLASDAIRTLDADGVWLRVESLVPVIGGMLAPAGVTLENGGQLTLRAQEINIADPMAATPPLDRARAKLAIEFSETRGQLTMGAAPTAYRLEAGQVLFNVDGAADSIALAGRINALLSNDARITTTLDTTLAGLLGQLSGKPQAATSTGQGITISATQVGRWLGAVMPATTPVRIEPGGQMSIALTGLAVAAPPAQPQGAAKAPAVPDIVQRLTANFDVTGSGVRFAPVLAAALPGEAAPTPEMIEMGNLALGIRMAPATPPSLTLDSTYTTAGQAFTMGGTMAMVRPLSQATTIRQMIPRGRMQLDQVPIELLRLLPMEVVGSTGQPVNLTALAGELLGRKVVIVFGLTGAGRGAPADHTGANFRISGRNFRLETTGVINAEGYASNESTVQIPVTPRLVQMVGNNFLSTMPHRPTLTQNAEIMVTVAPFTLPLDENLSPRPNSTIPLSARVETAMIVDNLVLAVDGNNQPINAGPVSLEGLRATATMPITLAAPVDPSAPAPATPAPPSTSPMKVDFALTARRPGRPDSMLASVTGNATRTGTALDATASLANLDLAWIESAIGKPAMITGALGPTLKLDATFAGDPAATANATLTLAAANLTMPQPFRVAMTPTAITLASPINASFNATPEWATRYMFGQTDPANMMVRVQRAIPFNINVPALTITRGDGRGPLVPGEWGVDATITTPEIAVVLKDGHELRYLNPEIIVRTARNNPRQINASVRMTEATPIAAATPATPPATTPAATPTAATPAAPGTPPSDPSQNILRISLTDLMDDAGQLNIPGASAEAIGRVPGFPTELLDAVAKQNGLLPELLGPAVTVDITARNVPLAFLAGPTVATAGAPSTPFGTAQPAAPAAPNPAANLRGRVEAQLLSERARARLAGDINNMVLTTSEPLSVDLNEITKAVSEHFASGMPLISTFEKPRSLQPATVRGDAITLPMDGNLANLNGRFAIDPGELQFTSSGILGSLLKFGGGQASGVAGRRLEPFTFTITSGVVNYDKFSLPLGEFTISTTGSVNLTNNTMDLLVYIPVGAVADDALGLFNVGLGSSLSQLAPGFDGALPFRIRGPMNSARPQPALDVFVKEFGSQLTNPGNLLDRFLRPGSGEGGGNGLPRIPFLRRGSETPPG